MIVNQASFAVEDALAAASTDQARKFEPDVIVGLPTLGIPFAINVARRLGHARMVPLGTSRKFWYDDALSQSLNSITSSGQAKRLYIDPRMVPLLTGRHVGVIDDVISTGSSMTSALRLLELAGVRSIATLGAGMLQGDRWRPSLAKLDPTIEARVVGSIAVPLLRRRPDGRWDPMG